MDGKICIKCDTWKTLDAFPTYDYGAGLRYRGECRTCNNQRRNTWRREKMKVAPPPQVPERRMCPGCETLRPASDFQRDKRSNDGLQTRCKYCRRKYYDENIEREKARALRHADKDREKSRRQAREWVKANPERARIIQQVVRNRRRVQKKGNGGTHTRQEWRALCAYYGYRCLCCGRAEPEIRLTVDHILPLSLGGRNDIANIQPLCRSCNSIKHKKTIDYRVGWCVNANGCGPSLRGADG